METSPVSAGKDVWGDGRLTVRRDRSSTRAGSPHPRTCANSSPTRGCPRASAPRASRAGSSPAGNPDLGLLICDSASGPRSSAARFTATGTRRRAGAAQSRALPPRARCARCSSTPAAPTPPPARAGLDDAAKTQGAAALAVGVATEEVALGSTGGISHLLPVERVLQGASSPPASSCAARATATSSRRSRRPTPSRSAPTWRWSCPPGRCA